MSEQEAIAQEGTQEQVEHVVDAAETTQAQESEQDSAKPQHFKHRSSKTPEELAAQEEVDSRSIYIGNVDYKTTPEELEAFFNKFGTINRVTILFDRYTGYPKGYAYVEYESNESVAQAVENLNKSEFKNRTISVVAKRTNLPGYKRGSFRRGRGGRGRGSFRGRGRGRGNFRGNSNREDQAVDATAEPATAVPQAAE